MWARKVHMSSNGESGGDFLAELMQEYTAKDPTFPDLVEEVRGEIRARRAQDRETPCREGPPEFNLQQLRNWDVFDLVQTLPKAQGEVVWEFWRLVRGLSLPHVQYSDGGMGFAWCRAGKVLDVEFLEDGRCEWFCSVKGPPKVLEGNEDEPVSVPTERILELIREHFRT